MVFRRLIISNGNEKDKVIMNKPVYLGLSILEISKTLMYEFCMLILNQWIIKTMQKYVIWTLTALLFILKLEIFKKILQLMVKKIWYIRL